MKKSAFLANALLLLLLAFSCSLDSEKVSVGVHCYMEKPSDSLEMRFSAPHRSEVVYSYRSEDGTPFESHHSVLELDSGNWTISGTAWLDGEPSGYVKRVTLPFMDFENPEIALNFYEPGWLEEDEI